MKKTGTDNIFIGTVESIDDPTFSGKIKVRVKGYLDNVPTDQLPWCYYGGSSMFSGNGGGSISIARVGQKVRVRFNNDDAASMEWYAAPMLDPDLINEIKSDYDNSQILLYDSAVNLSVKYQTATGLILYYQGSYIQIAPDNTITVHYGEGATGTQIQLSDGRVDVQAGNEINLTTSGTINLEADQIVLNAGTAIQMKGKSAGECAVNGSKLFTLLTMMAQAIDTKVPQTAGQTASFVNALKEGVMNQGIQYFK